MKVCVVAPAFPPIVGGAESLVASLTEALCQQGVTVHVLSSVLPSPDILATIGGAGGVVALPRPPRPGRLQWEHEAFYKAEALERLLAEERVDLVHAFSYDAAITAAIVCPRGDPGRVPVVGTFSEMTVPERARIEHLRAAFVFSLDALDLYVAISDMYADMALVHGLPQSRLRVNKAGIDVQRFAAGSRRRGRRRLGIDDRTLLVTCPSRFSKRKGQLDLLQAIALLEPSQLDVQLVLAGSVNSAYQEDLEAIMAVVERQRLRRPVRVLHDLPRGDMPDLLAASDLVVLPSHYEGLGFAALEAMAARTCVLLADTIGLDEVATHGKTAWFVPTHAPEALALALRKLLTDALLRRRLADAARAHVQQRFSMTATARRMVAIYRSLLAPSRESRDRLVHQTSRSGASRRLAE
jgi:glycosyltransferase involved in cell wall biosynthesis